MPLLPSIVTPALLSSIRRQPNLPHHTWYLIAIITLSYLNRPDEIPTVYKHAMDYGAGAVDSKPEFEEQLKISRRIREALVKAGAVTGMPKSINAILALKMVTPENLLDRPLEYSLTSRRTDVYDVRTSQILQRGRNFFDMVYGKVAKRVMGQMDESGTEDLGLMARLLYGYILSNTNVLSAAETSFIMIAGLIPQDVGAQLKGHLRGALNGGATVEEVKAVREAVIRICEAFGMTRIGEKVPGGWGWRGEVANL